MILNKVEKVSCDILVIGGGGAGLRTAIAAASGGARVLVISKTRIGRATNTYISKSVIAASGWGDADDNAGLHAQDTTVGGRFLNDPSIVARIAQQAKAEVAFLAGCGVPFEMEQDRLKVMQIPGHRHARHVYGANWVGRDLVLPLMRHAAKKGIGFMEHVFVTRLAVSGNRICGAIGVGRDGRVLVLEAPAVVLATGGYARIYLNTNNAPGITGDGMALAYGAGVALKDMEFIQFYPTARGRRGSRLFLYEKLLAQNGVKLVTEKGGDILERRGISHPISVTRDKLTQILMLTIMDQDAGGTPETDAGKGDVYMDVTTLSEEKARAFFPLLPKAYWSGQRRFKVMPTTHFCMGGVVIDDSGRTTVKGLFAAGEVTAGAHGANRLGGNALAEVFTMGSRAGEAAAGYVSQTNTTTLDGSQIEDEKRRLQEKFHPKGIRPGRLIEELKTVMWHKVGIIREKKGIEAALERIRDDWPQASIATPGDLISCLEFENMRLVAETVCRAALAREESRGSHYRKDFPLEDNENWLKNIIVSGRASEMALSTAAVTESKSPGIC